MPGMKQFGKKTPKKKPATANQVAISLSEKFLNQLAEDGFYSGKEITWTPALKYTFNRFYSTFDCDCLEMKHLTTNTHPVYAYPTAAITAVGFRRLKDYTGAQAPSVLLGAFFVPEGSPFGSAYWEAFGSAGFLCLRSANPMRAATIFFRREWCQLFLRQIQEDIMDQSIFTLRKDVTPSQLSNALYENAIQACALNDVLGEHLSNRSELPEDHYYEKTAQLQWALAGLLEQQRVVSDKLVMQRITCGEFEVGEAV